MSITEAHAAGVAGAELAAERSGDDWVAYAKAFLRRFLETHETMHVDELWAAGLVEPSSPRALGAVMQHAARQGWMRQITSKKFDGVLARPSIRSNGQLKPVWRSNICANVSQTAVPAAARPLSG
jgi:hypothetical protein